MWACPLSAPRSGQDRREDFEEQTSRRPVRKRPSDSRAWARAPDHGSDLDREGRPGAAPPTASRWQTCPSRELELELGRKPPKKKAGPFRAGGPADPTGSRGVGEWEAAAIQLCSLGCVSGGPRDPKRAHSRCDSPGLPAETAVKGGNGPPQRRLGIWGPCGKGRASGRLFMPTSGS